MQTTGERGDFFNPSLSIFGYNETLAMEYFPMSKTEASERSYTWQDNNYDPKVPENVKAIKAEEYTDQQWEELKNDNEIIKQIFICTESGRPFRILKQELESYRKHNVSLPKFHPDIRHEHRFKLKS